MWYQGFLMLIPRGPHQSCFANRTEFARQSRMSHWCCPKFHVLFLSKDNVLWFGIHCLDLTHTCAQHLFGLRYHNVVSFQTDNIRMASREIRAAGFPVMDFSHVWGSFLGESLIKPTMIKITPARLHFTMVKQLHPQIHLANGLVAVAYFPWPPIRMFSISLMQVDDGQGPKH